MRRYNPKEIEPKWQLAWDEAQVYKADLKSDKPKYIAMSMFNYPSGAGIHIGHAMNYTISDVMARFKRQQGYESYHPVGWDAFGLPAENFAIKTGVSPQASMATIIPSYHTQYKAMGWSNDWSKEIATHEPIYYKWTQWIFAEMFKRGMAYQDARQQWWCEKCQTVLANEQVIDGKCWRHDAADDAEVKKKEVKQWFFKVTDYAEEMLEATDDLDWSEVVKTAQKNWIGKSQGAEVTFALADDESRVASLEPRDSITVFTTRPDTLYGATFMVLAPEHELVAQITTATQRASVEAYIASAVKKSEVERQENKVKTGVFTGAFAINPVNGLKIPIWIADYVLTGYGTGAIMAVPAHDERDNEFAKKFDLPIRQVIMQCEEDSTNPTQKGFKEVVRDTVIAHLRNQQNGKFALLKWHGTLEGTTTAIMGGIESGQTAEQAAATEILEEAGLRGVRFVKKLRWLSGARYCASHKQENRKSIAHTLLAEIDTVNDQLEIDEKEKQTHTLIWVDENEVIESLTPDHQKFVWKQLQDETIVTEEGELVNSAEYTGLSSADAREKIIKDLEAKGLARFVTNFRIRDWSVSRQRYWGAPIPIINCPEHGAVLDEKLPVLLPELEDFQPSGDGRSALARATDWLNVPCPLCGKPAERETDTLDTYICSSWYMLRYFDPANEDAIFDTTVANKWMPIDFYNGGDHATAHMIYARFMTRFFHHIGLLESPEPFKRFLFNGKVTASDGTMFSKSKGNGVDPLEIIAQGYGADALRTYLMFAAPLDLWMRWDPQGVPGTYRFLNRVWNLVQEFVDIRHSRENGNPVKNMSLGDENNWISDQVGDDGGVKILRVIHPVIKKVTADLEVQKYNTAIATMMKCVNDLYELKAKDLYNNRASWQFALESLVALVAPFAPHIADELWRDLGRGTSVQRESWPIFDEVYCVADTVTLAVQVNGKLRGTVTVAADADEATSVDAAKADEKVASYLAEGTILKTIYVKNKLISFVVR